jgi:hypothetical protein
MKQFGVTEIADLTHAQATELIRQLNFFLRSRSGVTA